MRDRPSQQSGVRMVTSPGAGGTPDPGVTLIRHDGASGEPAAVHASSEARSRAASTSPAGP